MQNVELALIIIRDVRVVKMHSNESDLCFEESIIFPVDSSYSLRSQRMGHDTYPEIKEIATVLGSQDVTLKPKWGG